MVYHCPSCNLCRVGKGLGIDFFHCMTCNCCLGMNLLEHKCREKGLETNCPICCDFLFTSSLAVRSLPCGHFMHSSCFQVLFSLISLHFHTLICEKIVEIKIGKYYWMCTSFLIFFYVGIHLQPLYMPHMQQIFGRHGSELPSFIFYLNKSIYSWHLI